MVLKVGMISSWNVRCGIATYTANLASALAQEDVDVYIVRLSRFGKKTSRLLQNTVAKIPGEVDLVHVQHEYGLYQQLDPQFYSALRQRGKPIVTTMHAVGNWNFDKTVALSSNVVITHNEFCSNRLGFPNVIIPHGTQPVEPLGSDESKKSIGLDPRIPIVGYLGFISNYKGLETLIEAMRKVPNAALLIGGGWHVQQDTGYINGLKEVTLKVLPHRCRWLGFVSESDMNRVYSSMDIVVYPSRFTTESGALLTALSHGRAVISSRLFPFKEKEKQGALITYKNIKDLTRKIKKLFKNKDLRKKLEEGAKAYAEKNKWPNIARLHRTLYEDVLKKCKK